MSSVSTVPKVSVLVPTYNRSKYLNQTIDSILTQTFEDFEIVVIDNCSTDGTCSVVVAYTDARVIYYRNSYNVGPILNYNIALRKARGRYVYVFSDDDLMSESTNLAQKVAVLDQYPNVALVHSDINIIDSGGKVIGKNWASFNKEWPQIINISLMPGIDAYNILYYGYNFINMPAVMIRKSLLDRNKIEFNNQLGYLIDWNLWLQLSLLGDFYYINRILVSYRLHGQNESLKLSQDLMFRELVLAKIGLSTIYNNVFPNVVIDMQEIISSTRKQLKMNDYQQKFILQIKGFIKRLL